MKRFFVCAAAAIVALASCSKTQVVYNDAPEEIGFKAVSGVMTKAPITNTTFPEGQSITVYGWNNTGKAQYFPATVFSKNGAVWSTTPAQYYPTSGSLDFAAYTDMAPTIITPSEVTNETYTYTLADNSSHQHDFMVSEYVVNKASSANAVGINFSHALALIEVNVQCTGTTVTVNSVSLSGTKQNGKVTVTYDDADDAVANVAPNIGNWNVDGAVAKTLTKTADVALTAGADAVNYAHFLVVPENGTGKILTINYTLNGNNFSHPINLNTHSATTWTVGTKHIFNITIGLDQITFTPAIGTDWSSETPTIPSI